VQDVGMEIPWGLRVKKSTKIQGGKKTKIQNISRLERGGSEGKTQPNNGEEEKEKKRDPPFTGNRTERGFGEGEKGQKGSRKKFESGGKTTHMKPQ